MMVLTPGTSCSAARGCERRTIAPQVMSTLVAPMAPSAAWVVRSISSLSGQAGVVSSILSDRLDPSMTTSLTMSRLIRSRPSSGSWTVRIASMTASWVRLGIGGGFPSHHVTHRGVLTAEASISYPDLGPGALGRRVVQRPHGFRHVVSRNPRISQGSTSEAAEARVLDTHRVRPYPLAAPRTTAIGGSRGSLAGVVCAHDRRQARGCGQEVRRGGRRRPHRPRGSRRGILQPARAVGLRQDDDAADDRRLRGTDLGADRAPGPGRDLAAALQAQRQHGLPELRAVPAPDDLRERGLRPAPEGRQGCRGQEPGHGDAQAWSSCPGTRRASRRRSRVARRSASRSPER